MDLTTEQAAHLRKERWRAATPGERALRGVELFDILVGAVRAALRYEFPDWNEHQIESLCTKRIHDIRWHTKGRRYVPAYCDSTYKQVEQSWADFKFEDEKAAEAAAIEREAAEKRKRAYDATPCLFSSTSTARSCSPSARA